MTPAAHAALPLEDVAMAEPLEVALAPRGSAGSEQETAGQPAAGRDASAQSALARGCVVAAGVVVVDQLTKAGATALGNTAVTHPVTNPEFSLGLAGGSLSMMVLVTVAGIVAFGAYVVWQAVRGRLAAWVPGLLLGGAVSNLVDRLLFGAVRDFVPSVWVVWNLADLAVLVGIAGYAWGHLRRSQPITHHPEEVNLT